MTKIAQTTDKAAGKGIFWEQDILIVLLGIVPISNLVNYVIASATGYPVQLSREFYVVFLEALFVAEILSVLFRVFRKPRIGWSLHLIVSSILTLVLSWMVILFLRELDDDGPIIAILFSVPMFIFWIVTIRSILITKKVFPERTIRN